MLRSNRNDRKTKNKKAKVQSKEEIRCMELLKALQERSDFFMKGCKKFSDTSNKFVVYCKECQETAQSTLSLFETFITIYVYYWKQYIYLYYGICSFQYQLEESLDNKRTVRDTTKHEVAPYIEMFIRVGGQNKLTDTSLEGIFNFFASNDLNDEDFLMTLEATVKVHLQEAENYITDSVKRVTDYLYKLGVTKNHKHLVPIIRNASINFEYHYEECYQKVKAVILKKGGITISSFSDTLERLQAFNDSVTVPRNQSTRGKVAVLTTRPKTVPPTSK